jgi:hypothetical protein
VGALAHYIEAEGVATTQISLIRVHTEKIKPPRALWVPFELGRQLGAPNDPEFQSKVIRAALSLLTSASGPFLSDFPEEAPVVTDDAVVLACPYVPGTMKESTHSLDEELQLEINSLKPWYLMAKKVNAEDFRGVSQYGIDEIINAIMKFLSGEDMNFADGEIPAHRMLRFMADDLKAFYYVAVSSQPGSEKMRGEALENWFWTETVAGGLLRKIRKHCLSLPDPKFNKGTANALVPARFVD